MSAPRLQDGELPIKLLFGGPGHHCHGHDLKKQTNHDRRNHSKHRQLWNDKKEI